MKKYIIYITLLITLPTLSLADYDYFDHLPSHIQPLTLISVHARQNPYNFVSKKQGHTALLSKSQQKRALRKFMEHYFSPWASPYTDNHFRTSSANHYLRSLEAKQISYYKRHPGWGENHHTNTHAWINKVINNVDIRTFPNKCRPAITVDNAYVRSMPTIVPDYNRFGAVGEGYPFDNFQTSVVWTDTPIFVIHLSKDGAWAFVATPSVTGWIQTKDLAYVSENFMHTWRKSNFAATIVDHFPIKDTAHIFRATAHLGSIFPLQSRQKSSYKIAVPVKDLNGNAVVRPAIVSSKWIQAMPYAPTQYHIAGLIHEILGTPYGWGGLYYYNDCSSSLKNIFTPFGIWLPRNSKAQLNGGPTVSLQNDWPSERESYILKHGVPFMTLIYVTGHIMLYLGEKDGHVMTFQDVWALVSSDSHHHEGRAVIGKAVLMPLRLRYKNSALFPQINGDHLTLIFLSKI